jgi:hypothetical protein
VNGARVIVHDTHTLQDNKRCTFGGVLLLMLVEERLDSSDVHVQILTDLVVRGAWDLGQLDRRANNCHNLTLARNLCAQPENSKKHMNPVQ